MGAFDDLRADADVMRAGNNDNAIIEALDDDALIILQLAAAKKMLKSDLRASIKEWADGDPADTDVDKIADLYTDELAFPLGWLQMLIFYEENFEPDSKNSHRSQKYKNLYDTEKAKFTNYKLSNKSSTRMVGFSRG